MVDPETQAHVRVSHKASDSTARHVLVLVHVAVLERHDGYATEQVNVDKLASSGGTSCRIGEHEMLKLSEQMATSMNGVAKPGQGLEPWCTPMHV